MSRRRDARRRNVGLASSTRACVLALVALATMSGPAIGTSIADEATSPAEALARRGVDDVASGDSERERIGARELVHAGEAGFSLAGSLLAPERLGRLPLRETLALVDTLACFDSGASEERLSTLIDDPRFEVRALVAQGLGGGKSEAGVGRLIRLAGDPMPSVRAAALRALFAIDRPDARAARAALPPDASPELRTRRLRLHRLRRDEGAAVYHLAGRAFLGGTTSAERTAGARLLVAQRAVVPPDLRRLVIGQLGGARLVSCFVRAALGAPPDDPDPAEARLAAAEALLAHVAIGGIPDAERDAALDLAVGWIAQPARVQSRQVDEEARDLLLAALPDLTTDPAVRATIVADVTQRLRSARFDDPSHGVRLLLAVGRSAALPALVSLVEPERVAPGVLAQVSGALRDLRRVGDAETARRLVDPARPSDVRTDGTRALAGEPWSLARPFLAALLLDRDDAVASHAATVLLGRPEPEARALLEAALLDAAWRPYEQNATHALTGPADDAGYALLERMLRHGSTLARRAVFIEITDPASSLHGPRAVALVRLAIDNPSFEIDIGTIATALSSVDGPAAVRYIRENWGRVTRPGVLLRNLQVVAEPEALDFALEIAATIADGDDRMLPEVATVLSGRCATQPRRTDPFWLRLLAHGSAGMKRVAVRALTNVEHGPMSAYLVPFLADADQTASSRRDALLALERGKEPLPEALLWTLASDRLEDEDLRLECARALVGSAGERVRDEATNWLAQCVEESSLALVRVAEIAGTGATVERAGVLLDLFRRALARRFEAPPYFRVSDDDAARSIRVQALTIAVATTRDPALLDALADALVDPRFALFQLESRRAFASVHGGGGGPLTSGIDPLELDVALRFDGSSTNETPRPPVPPEALDIVEALVKADPRDGVRRIADRLARARADGSLARFDDLYIAWIARRLASATASDAQAGAAPAPPPAALPIPARPDGPESTFDLDRRSQLEEAARRFDAATSLARASLLAGARCGVVDLAPSRWLDRGRVPQPSWSLAKCRIELLEAATLATSDHADEARSRFARATAAEPLDPRVFQEAAQLRLRIGFDPESALADARRAAELERRQGIDPSRETGELLAAASRAKDGK